VRGDRRKMMPIGNISSRNFWRVRGQKTTAQVINSSGEATSTTGTRPRLRPSGQASRLTLRLAARRRRRQQRKTRRPASSSFSSGKEKKNVSLPCSFFWVWELVLAVAASVVEAMVVARELRSSRRMEKEATIKLGDSIWDTIKKASP
jgi:hypothetical protein